MKNINDPLGNTVLQCIFVSARILKFKCLKNSNCSLWRTGRAGLE